MSFGYDIEIKAQAAFLPTSYVKEDVNERCGFNWLKWKPVEAKSKR